MFHPITSFVTLVECVPAHTNTLISVSRSQFSIEVSSNYRYVSLAVFCVLLDHLEHISDVVVRISRVGEVFTHQFDALAVDHGMARSFTYSVSIILCFHFCSVRYLRRVCCHIFLHP